MDSLVPHPFTPKLEFAFTITIKLAAATYMTPSVTGQDRVAVYVESGTVEGKINGRVMPMSGADWALKRPDGVIDFDARYMLELDDGTPVYLQNRGYRWGSDDAMARMKRQEPVSDDEYYMRVSPKWEVPAGPHEWLARYVFVGVAEKTPGGNRIHYFVVK